LDIESQPNQKITTNIDFGSGGISQGILTFYPMEDNTRVTWTFINENGMNPFNRIIGTVFIGPIVGESYEKGLSYLDEVASRAKNDTKDLYSLSIEETEMEPIHYLGIRKGLPENYDDIGPAMASIFGELCAFVSENNLIMTGQPMTVYYTRANGSIDMKCAVPLEHKTKGNDHIIPGTTMGGLQLKAVHLGDYHALSDSYDSLMNYASANGYKQEGEVFEIYITDPGVEKDTSKWETDIFLPVSKTK